MRVLVISLSIILAIIGLALSILPFGFIALIPTIAAFVCALIAFKLSQKENKGTTLIKIILTVIILSLILSIYNALKPNEISVDQETIEMEKQNDEETMEQLEDIEIED